MARPARKLTRRSASLLLVALFLVLATVVGLASYGVELGGLILGSMQTAVRGVGSALATAVESVGAYGKALVYARGIYAENDNLRLENQYLSAQLTMAKDDAAELARLQAQLGLQQGLAVKTVLARVTGRTTNLGSLDVFIDHGSSTGVAAGAGVFAADPVTGQVYAFGKVHSASRSTAVVLSLLDSRCVISGINRRTGEDVLVKGADEDYCRLSYISPLPQFQAGDIVLTSSSSSLFPPNTPIGVVTQLTTSDSTQLVLRPFAAVWGTRTVLVTLGAT